MKTRSLFFAILICSICIMAWSQCPSYTTTNTQTGTCSEPAGNITLQGPGAVTLTVNGNLTINGNLNVVGETLVVNGSLTVTGAFNSGIGSSVTIANGGDIDANSLASGLGATFTVENGGTLMVTNDAGTGLFAAFTVESGGFVDVGGNFVTGGIGSATIDGDMNVDGDFTNAGGGVLGGSGILTVGGTYTNDGDDTGYSGTFNGAPLPVELVYFSGNLGNGGVALEWQTSTEINNKGFEIERSGDGEYFATIGWVKGNGNSNDMHEYSFTDSNPYLGLSYYRFRQVDFDGQSEYSPIIRIEGEGTSSTLAVYPNPTSGPIRILNELSEFQLYDPSGRLVLQKKGNYKNGSRGTALETAADQPDRYLYAYC